MLQPHAETQGIPRSVRIANRVLPTWLMRQPLAEKIVRSLPHPKPYVRQIGIEVFQEPGCVYDRVGSYEGYFSGRALALARKAFGKHSPAQAKNILLAGIECWHAQMVLASRIDNNNDAKEILRSRTNPDEVQDILAQRIDNAQDAKELLRCETVTSGPAQTTLIEHIRTSQEARELLVEGVGPISQCYLAKKIDNSGDAKGALVSGNVTDNFAQRMLAEKIDNAEHARAVLGSAVVKYFEAVKILLQKSDTRWLEEAIERATAR